MKVLRLVGAKSLEVLAVVAVVGCLAILFGVFSLYGRFTDGR